MIKRSIHSNECKENAIVDGLDEERYSRVHVPTYKSGTIQSGQYFH